MTVIQQILENQISLMKQCLEFYGNEKNHIKDSETQKSLIDTDKGFLANETLKNIQRLEDQNKQLSDQYEAIAEAQSSPEALLAEVQKIIEGK